MTITSTVDRRSKRRMPVRYALSRTETGAACLAMVLTHHGRHTSVPDVRAALGSGRDGGSLDELAEAAEQVGMSARVGALGERVTEPVVVRLAADSHVVVRRADARRAWVVDPALGRQRWDRAEFDRRHDGTALHLTPTVHFGRRRAGSSVAVRYLRMLLAAPGGRRLLVLILLLAAGMQVLGLATPLLTQFVVDELVPADRAGTLTALTLGVVAVALLAGLLATTRALVLLALRRRADLTLTGGFVDHLVRLPVGFFLDRGRGDLLMRLSSVSSTRETLTQQLLTTVLDGFLLTGYLVGLAVIAPSYLPVIGPLFLLHLAVLAGSHRTLRGRTQRELIAKAEEQSHLTETMQAVVPIKANGLESRVLARWTRLFDTYQQAVVRRGRAAAWVGGAQQALRSLGPLVLLVAGAWLVLDGRLSLGGMLAANAVALAVLTPLDTFANLGQLYHSVLAQMERLFDVLDTPKETGGTVRLPAGATGLELSGVSFSYHDDQPPVLDDIDLRVAPGGTLGVVGRTGSGKSTLGLLVLGLLANQTGTVRHHGVPIGQLDLDDLRSGCGAVLQELTLFNGTVRDNLVLGKPDATDAEVTRAAELAGLHEDVLALPRGYDTEVGESGAALSAGQCQRVVLARALVHRPRLLVLDEATSHLDPRTERRVDEALGTLSVTRIVISHRLSAVRGADQIVVLDRGRIVQRGTHDDLIARAGLYRDLFAGENQPCQ